MFKLKKVFAHFVMQIYTFICKTLSDGKKIFSFFPYICATFAQMRVILLKRKKY